MIVFWCDCQCKCAFGRIVDNDIEKTSSDIYRYFTLHYSYHLFMLIHKHAIKFQCNNCYLSSTMINKFYFIVVLSDLFLQFKFGQMNSYTLEKYRNELCQLKHIILLFQFDARTILSTKLFPGYMIFIYLPFTKCY